MSQAASVPPGKPGINAGGPREFLVSSAPHLADRATTPRIMFEVVLAMVPLLVAGMYFFRAAALLLTVACVAGCLVAEAVANRMRGESQASLRDGSAVVTGMILAFSLPASMAAGGRLYMAFLGGVVSIALGKAVFGGLGNNLFNPAMVGRAFLMVCFPAAMAAWVPTAPMMPEAKARLAMEKGVEVDGLRPADVDAITTATPLYQAAKLSEYVAKAHADPGKRDRLLARARQVRDEMPGLWRLAVGNVGGCVGETSALLALLCGLWLVARKIADWRQPVAMLAVVAVFAGLSRVLAPDRFPGALYHLTSGSLMFGAFFIATEYVGSPLTPSGRMIFGAGVGLLVMLIRTFGAYPEGVMFAILIMNALTPLIENATRRKPFGGLLQS